MDIQTWAKKMQQLIDKMPSGYECIVDYSSINVHPEGTMKSHHESGDDGFGVSADPVANIGTKRRIIPYSEGA
jgi:hypothetical protein